VSTISALTARRVHLGRRWVGAFAFVVLGVVAAVWLRLSPSAGDFREYRMLAPTDIPAAVAAGPDGAVWFTIDFSESIGVVRDGQVRKIPKGSENLEPLGLAVDAAGNAWYADSPARAIGRVSVDGVVTRYTLDAPLAQFGRLAVGPDNAVWLADAWGGGFVRLRDGEFKQYPVQSATGRPFGVAVDRSGTVWGSLQAANRLVRIPEDGPVTELDVPTRGAIPSDLAVDATGTVWFLETRANKIGRFADGRFAEFAVPTPSAGLSGLAIGLDGSVWFAELRGQRLGRLRDGEIVELPLPRADARPVGVAVDAAGNVWYADLSGWVGELPVGRAAARTPDLWRLLRWRPG
jgi:virginiamycin B lyase